jgi:hypothetical protein
LSKSSCVEQAGCDLVPSTILNETRRISNPQSRPILHTLALLVLRQILSGLMKTLLESTFTRAELVSSLSRIDKEQQVLDTFLRYLRQWKEALEHYHNLTVTRVHEGRTLAAFQGPGEMYSVRCRRSYHSWPASSRCFLLYVNASDATYEEVLVPPLCLSCRTPSQLVKVISKPNAPS